MAGQRRSIPNFTAAALVLLAISGCAWDQPYQQSGSLAGKSHYVPSVVADSRTVNERAAIVAMRQIGTPYRYGGMSPGRGFDCSGLVVYAYQKARIKLP